MLVFEERSFDDATTYLEALRPLNWASGKSWSMDWYFRGHGDSKWLLLPSAMRKQLDGASPTVTRLTSERFRTWRNNIIWQAIEQTIAQNELELSSVMKERAFEVLLQAHTEYIRIKELLGLLDTLGLRHSISEVFSLNTGEFIEHYASNLFNNVDETGNHHIWMNPSVALAQHHGIPTRLLDWTRNPLIAAYFAAEAADENSQAIAVYAVHRTFLRNRRIATVTVASYESTYLHAQAGLFTLDKMADSHYIAHGDGWAHLDKDIPEFTQYTSPRPLKLILPMSCVNELLRLLWLENITRAHLMPTLDNAVIALKKKWQIIQAIEDSAEKEDKEDIL